MVNRVQTLRSSTPGNRPAAGTRAPGELYVNWPDSQIGVIDSGQNPQDLLVVRKFSTTSSYNAGDYVVQNQQLYQAAVPVTPGAFNGAQWQAVPEVIIATAPPSAPSVGELWFDDVGQQLYIYYNDGTSSQWVPTTNQTFSGIYMPLSGGTITGNLTVNGTTSLQAATGVTPTAGDNSTKLATTAFVLGQASTTSPAMDSASVIGTSAFFARADHVHPSDTTKLNVSGGTVGGLSITGNVYVGGNFGLTASSGFIQANGGAQFYAGSYGGNTVQIQNANLQSSSWIGMLANTPNSFASNSSYVWGAGFYGNAGSGGGGFYSRVDQTTFSFAGWLWGTSSLVGSITTNGSTVAYNTGSDGRLKQNIRNMADDIDVGAMIDAIRPVTFEWKDRHTIVGEPGAVLFADDIGDAPPPTIRKDQYETRGTTTGHGFVAQELIKVAPFAVHAPDDGVRKLGKFEDGHIPWGVDNSKLIPYMIAELQSLRRRVAELEGAR